ncbi:MAG: ATP-binding cassette domain-containing protein, partial [Bacillota bacterium]|nr:ATP-binding cassette domain-containing protein [Bacillota bacterium]
MIFVKIQSLFFISKGACLWTILTNNLSKQFKTTTALDNISLSIPKGAIYGLIGNNGAGKTTLMSILATLQKQTSGSVYKAKDLKIGALIDAPA